MTLYKKFKISIVAGLSLAVLTGTSCKKVKEFGDLNQDPTATTAPIPPALLSNVLSNMATFTWDAGGINTVSGLYSQYFSETQYTDASTYSKQSLNWDDYFAGSSTNASTQVGYLNNLQAIISYCTNPATATTAATYGSVNNQIAIARILKAYIFSQLTDAFGDMPYFGALKGDNGTVVYDKQSVIYTDLFKELTQAVAQFDGGTVSGDILFSGNTTKWKKFANSLHALLALHLSKVDAATGKKEFAAALAASGGVIEEGGDVSLAFPGG
ncbi:MAG: SusD/RagB family nutrient-binding outer membrane lipoprotein, partial [Bacteroidetes bacterium]|nr:SusD/RagB family nutrient-binding outer membrane lipoprotein [Bacteroidota bacterium]